MDAVKDRRAWKKTRLLTPHIRASQRQPINEVRQPLQVGPAPTSVQTGAAVCVGVEAAGT